MAVKHRDVIAALQQGVSRGHAGNTGADNCNM